MEIYIYVYIYIYIYIYKYIYSKRWSDPTEWGRNWYSVILYVTNEYGYPSGNKNSVWVWLAKTGIII